MRAALATAGAFAAILLVTFLLLARGPINQWRAAQAATDDVRHQPGTALLWRSCPAGELRPEHGCGEGVRWAEAVASCAAPFRLATSAELRSVAGPGGCENSEICRALFGADDGIYWSSTQLGEGYEVVWFSNGDVTVDRPREFNLVRCVREID